MKTKLFSLILVFGLSGITFARQDSHDLGKDAARQEQQQAKEQKKQAEKQRKDQEKEQKKLAEKQKKADEQARKKEGKEEAKKIEEQQKKDAKKREDELKKQNDELAKQQKQERERTEKDRDKQLEEQQKAQAKMDRDHDRDRNKDQDVNRDQNAQVPPAPNSNPQAVGDRDRVAGQDHDRDQNQNEPVDRDHDFDRQQATDQDRNEHRDRDNDQYANGNRSDRDYQQTRDNDRYAKHDRMERRRVPIATRASAGALQAQRNVSRTLYQQMPNSNVNVLVNNNNQIVLQGSAPNPGIRHRLLQLAGAAAGGYGIVDQLASDAVSSAASTATGAAINGVSGLIHGSGSSDYSGSDTSSPSYDSNSSSGYQSSYGSNLQAGSNACVNVNNSNQLVLSGNAESQADADRFYQLAQQLAGTSANVVNELSAPYGTSSTTASGSAIGSSSMNSSTTGTSSNLNSSAMNSTAVIGTGSVVCMNVNNSNQVVLTGTVASPSERARVERTLQPVIGSTVLVNQLNTAVTQPGITQPGTHYGEGAEPENDSYGAPVSGGDNGLAVQAQVEQALHSVPRLADVDVTEFGNTLRLTGTVDSANDVQMARNLAQQYAPGMTVENNLTVRGGAAAMPR